MIDLIQHPLIRLTLLFVAAIILLRVLHRSEPSWRIALIRGIFPGGLLLILCSAGGISWTIPGWEKSPPTEMISVSRARPPDESVGDASPESLSSVAGNSVTPPVPLPAITLISSLSITALLFLRLGITLINERKRLASAVQTPDTAVALWKNVCAEVGVKPRGIATIPGRLSPHLCPDGTLVIPASLFKEEDSCEHLVHAFRHEAAHLKAGDHFWFPLLSAMTAIFWFHPLAWWLAARHLVSCEEARDAEAARLGGADAYRQSIARVALELVPSSLSAPSLLRKDGNLLSRLKRVPETSRQSPPLTPVVLGIQCLLVALAGLMGTATPSLAASGASANLFGMWRAEDRGNRFARQLEVYEWGDEVKLRIWHSLGNDGELHGATVTSFEMSRTYFDQRYSKDNFISVEQDNGFSQSIYTLSIHGGLLEFGVKRHYTDNSNRGDQDFISFFERGTWAEK
ncbi:MAG: M56 family metallopeptidase [Verrucomicrobiales bacterium]|nr:M56 family metallopeptidase [Verrucomicrobiales bacterium]